MKFLKELLFSTSIRASFTRVVAAGLAWALTALSGMAIFAHVEMPSAQWLDQSSTFISALLLAVVAHIISLVSTKKQKAELPK